MKTVCKSCPLSDKREKSCQRRNCKHANPIKINSLDMMSSKISICENMEIDASSFKLHVSSVLKNGFIACIEELCDKSEERGHFGSYITEGRYYKFNVVDDETWSIPDESTERFHREGSSGAQVLLYRNEMGFSAELDS